MQLVRLLKISSFYTAFPQRVTQHLHDGTSRLMQKEFEMDSKLKGRLTFTLLSRSIIRARNREGRASILMEKALNQPPHHTCGVHSHYAVAVHAFKGKNAPAPHHCQRSLLFDEGIPSVEHHTILHQP